MTSPPLPPLLNCKCPKLGSPSLKGPLRTSSLPSQKAGGGRYRGGLSTTSWTFWNWRKKQVKRPERRIVNFLKTFSFQMEITLTEIKIGTRPAETLLEKLKLLCFKMKWSQWINSLSQATKISTVNDLFTAKTFCWLINIQWADVSYMQAEWRVILCKLTFVSFAGSRVHRG